MTVDKAASNDMIWLGPAFLSKKSGDNSMSLFVAFTSSWIFLHSNSEISLGKEVLS